MKRVLFIAYYYPPLADSGTQRPLKFSRYLPDHGWEPIVLTVADPPNPQVEPSLLREIRPGTRVVRVPMTSTTVGKAVARFVPTAKRDAVASGIEWRLRNLRRMPDIYALWRGPARRAALEIFRREGFDAIYATGYPWTSVLVGRDVSKATGRPLIADFRDPWSSDEMFDPPLSAAERRRHHHLEASVIQQASRVLAVSELMTEDLREAHPGIPAERFHTVANGFDPEDLKHAEPFPPPPPGTFRFVYAGVWRKGYGLDLFYNVLERMIRDDPRALDRFELVAAGFPPGEAQKRGLERWVRELGRVPHPVALGLMRSGNALFVTMPSGAYQRIALPGKLFEYLGSQRPVVLMCHEAGESSRLIGRTGGGVVIGETDDAALTALIRHACQTSSLDVPPLNRDRLGAYHRQALAGQLAEALNRACS